MDVQGAFTLDNSFFLSVLLSLKLIYCKSHIELIESFKVLLGIINYSVFFIQVKLQESNEIGQ